MKRYYYLSSPGWGWYDDVHPLAQREVFMNGNKIDIGTSTLGSAIGKISSARLEIEDDLCDSTHLGITIDPRNWADCDEAGWFPTDPLTLRITQGKEYIEFYNKATGNFLGDEIFIDQLVQWEDIRLGWGIDWEKDALDDIVLKQINPLPQDSVPLNLIVEASINELIFETEYEFFPDSFSIMTWQYPEVIYSGQTVDIEFEIFNYCESFPEEAEINIEIIEGNEYGGLIDPYTEETVQSIMAIEHYEGYSYFQYIADGAAVDSSVNVVVSISTTDPDLPHRDYNMTIYPSPIVIITEPENLIPGELTNIIIKKRETDGTIVDFPPEQTFEVGMLDGCPIGNIIAGGDTNKYFYDITQPIYFLTDSSADSGTVKLVAGLIEDGGVLIGSNVPMDVNNNHNYLDYSKCNISCSNQTSILEIEEVLKEEFNKKLMDFENELYNTKIKKWGFISKTATSYQKLLAKINETTDTHNTKEVQDVITKYQNEIAIIIGELQFGKIIIEP